MSARRYVPVLRIVPAKPLCQNRPVAKPKDFLDDLIEKRTTTNPEFPDLMQKAAERREQTSKSTMDPRWAGYHLGQARCDWSPDGIGHSQCVLVGGHDGDHSCNAVKAKTEAVDTKIGLGLPAEIVGYIAAFGGGTDHTSITIQLTNGDRFDAKVDPEVFKRLDLEMRIRNGT